MITNKIIKPISGALFILYVTDQERCAKFYAQVLGITPTLHVPGMTEFTLGECCKLGLMPKKGAKHLLGARVPDLEAANSIPRAEIYLYVDDPEIYHKRALVCGAKELIPFSMQEWGDMTAYSLDPEGHVLVFAKLAGIE